MITGAPAARKLSVILTTFLFKAGHRLRLHVAGTSFPYYGRSPGVCVRTTPLPAHAFTAVSQFLLHGRDQQSWLTLKVVGLDEAAAG